MVVLGRRESLCTDVIDVDSGDADNDDDDGKCDDVEKAAVAPRPRAEHWKELKIIQLERTNNLYKQG